MSREEILQRIDNIETAIFYCEMADRGYDFDKVRKLKRRKDELLKQLQEV